MYRASMLALISGGSAFSASKGPPGKIRSSTNVRLAINQNVTKASPMRRKTKRPSPFLTETMPVSTTNEPKVNQIRKGGTDSPVKLQITQIRKSGSGSSRSSLNAILTGLKRLSVQAFPYCSPGNLSAAEK